MPTPSLLQRLRERKLVQWAVAYAAGAFVVFQLLDALSEPLSLTTTIQRGILAVVVVGFFITLVLAWYHGEKGRQRVSGPELLLIALLLAMAGGGLYVIRGSEVDGGSEETAGSAETQPTEDPRPRILVLACKSISADPEVALVAEGLHETIVRKLGGISGLRPLGSETGVWYRDNPKPPAEIAAEQRLDFVGLCSIQKYAEEDRISITFQLVDEEGALVWTDEYDRDLSARAVLDLNASVASQLAERVAARVTPQERLELGTELTHIPEAHDAYLRGRNLNSRAGTESSRRAIDLLKEAVGLDPEFSEAWVELGRAYRLLV